ncbi:MAG: lytic murein transglycosylase B [Thiothrix lacustris]|uniref:Lytic murein transglycosylase B n=1 Tax=Thiothrix lacustris TaxID=525917 RepID=A0A1Y1Q9L6_9GAMM|nr:MAG: lytic murein transglycosylase B [Thiothrix lacustris]
MVLSLGACSSVPEKSETADSSSQQVTQPTQPKSDQAQAVSYGGKGVGNYAAGALSGDFAGDQRMVNFIENLVQTQGFDRQYLYGVFSQVRNRDDVSRLWASSSNDPGSPKGWNAYRDRFVTAANVQRGTEFWQQHAPYLQRAQQQYGVPAEYIVGIMGIETRWGRILGKHKVIDALTTSAITNERRSKFFFDELKNYMLMTRSERMDPLAPKGSFAGAMGYGQFMPSSFHGYAVDFNGDGVRDLWNPQDAIGSIANYFAKHGWQPGGEVAVPAEVSSNTYASVPDGYKVKYSMADLTRMGVSPKYGNGSAGPVHLLALSTVPNGYKEPWVGYKNFYVITRYNHSNYYAMTVHLLAQAVRERVGK